MGCFVDTDFIIPMIIDHLADKDSVSLPHYTSSCLNVFAQIVLFSTAKFTTIHNHLHNILDLVSSSDYLNSESVAVLEAVLKLTKNVIKSCGTECQKYKRDLFKVLLQLGSLPGTVHLHAEVDHAIELLAVRCGCKDTDELFSMELEALLKEMKETYMNWDDNTADRFIFDMLCRKSNEAVVEHWELILEIVGMNCTYDKSSNLRMDMLALIEHFLAKSSLQDTLQYYGEVLILGILQPCIEWRIGIPNVKIRQAGIVCMKKLIDCKLIEKEDLHKNFMDIFNNLKNCLDDDFSSEIRFAATVLLKTMINYSGTQFVWDDFKEVYPELLKRLDDSQDGIRLEACKAFEIFFEVLPEDWAKNLVEYMVQNIFIHLDDSDTQIQEAIAVVLNKAAKVHKDVVIGIGRSMSGKFQHQTVIENLLENI